MPHDPTIDRYIENVGHEPRGVPEDVEWQWRYRGTAEERELLLDLVQTEAEEAVQQETLF